MHLALLTILACAHTIPPLPQGAVLVLPDGTGVLGAGGGGGASATPPPVIGSDVAGPNSAAPSGERSFPTLAASGPSAHGVATPDRGGSGANGGGVPSATPPPVIGSDLAGFSPVDREGPGALVVAEPVVTAEWIEYATGTMPGRLSAAHGGPHGSVPGTYSGVLIRHGSATLLVDGGASRDFEVRRRAMGGLQAIIFGQASRGFVRVGHPDALLERPDAALLTHAHFDHVGGFLDVPDLPVWTARDEFAAAMPGEAELLAARLRPIPWEDRPFLYWPQRWEPFGDERVVVVPMPGHTGGSVGVYVQPSGGDAPFFLVGDTAWLREAYEVPTPKGWPASTLDADRAGVDLQLARLHTLHAALPSLRIVPAHDRRVYVEVFGAPVPLATPEK